MMSVRLQFLMMIVLIAASESVAENKEGPLIKRMFKNYEKLERPTEFDNEQVSVTMMAKLRQLMAVDVKNQLIQTNMWLTFNWTEPRFAFKDLNTTITSINVPYHKAWTPDILLWNSGNKNFDGMVKTNLQVFRDGTVKWVTPAIFTSTCSMTIAWFPFDEQTCKLKLSSWTNSMKYLDMQSAYDDVRLDSYIRSGEWDLLQAKAKRTEMFYECCPDDKYVDVTLIIVIRRRPLYYLFNIIFPSVIQAAIGLFTFTMPVESWEKVTLAVTIQLSLSFFMIMVADYVPPTAEIPLLSIYFFVLMFLTTVIMFVTVFVSSIHWRVSIYHPIPYWVSHYINTVLARCIGISRTSEQKGDDDCEMEMLKRERAFSQEILAQRVRQLQSDPALSKLPSMSKSVKQLRRILAEVRYYNDFLDDVDNRNAVSTEWKFCAHVIDRLSFWVVNITFIVSSIAMIMVIPYHPLSLTKNTILNPELNKVM